jgi:hypothetical protein
MRLNRLLLALIALAIATIEVVSRPAASVEATVRRYATAVSAANLDAALAEVAPEQRAQWTDWVRDQVGNVYEVTGIAVHVPTIVGPPTDVTVVLDVDRGDPDQFYQPTTRVNVEQVDGRWYLSAPLLAP